MNCRRVVLASLLILAVFIVAACGGGDKKEASAPAAEKIYTIRVASWYGADHPQTLSLNKFKEIVEKNSKGKMKVQVFSNSQLGSEDVYIDSVKKGTVEMGVAGIIMARDVPTIAVAEMPFIYTSWDHVRKVFTGPLGAEVTKGMIEKTGTRNLAWTGNGFRVISSNRELNKFEDFKGLRLRVPNTPYYVEMAKGLGANPITMAFGELFTALEQKVVDGQENPYLTIRASKLYEVQKYILDSKHIFSPGMWIINEKYYQALPADYQKVLNEAALEAAAYNWQLSMTKDNEDMGFLKEKGLKITIPDPAFQQKMVDSQKSVQEWFYVKYPGTKELAEKIRAIK